MKQSARIKSLRVSNDRNVTGGIVLANRIFGYNESGLDYVNGRYALCRPRRFGAALYGVSSIEAIVRTAQGTEITNDLRQSV